MQQFAKVVALSRLHKDHMISRVQILELVLELFVIYAVDNVGPALRDARSSLTGIQEVLRIWDSRR